MKTKVISLLIIVFMIGLGVDGFAQSEDEAIKLSQKGADAYQYGRYEKAFAYYEKSLKIFRDLNIPQYIAISLGNIGGVYKALGQYEKALSYFDESLKIGRELKI